MSAAGKKNRLKMKYPMKLWPLRPATRAGQNAITIQTKAIKTHHRMDMTYSPSAFRAERCYVLLNSSPGTGCPLESGHPMHPQVP
jgi:hypothetical protein